MLEIEYRVTELPMRLLLASALALAACTPPPPPAPAPPKQEASLPALETTDVVVGTGAEVKKGSAVAVNYVGKLADGTVFDSSLDRGQTFSFIVGQGKVIRGWEEGILGMKVGGKRKLVIPPHLGYGPEGQPPKIPGNATLYFEIDLVHVVE